MDVTGAPTPQAADPSSVRTSVRTGARAVIAAAARTPFTPRAWAELLYAALAAVIGIVIPYAAFGFVAGVGLLSPGAGENASIYGLAAALAVLLVLAPRLARAVGGLHRRLAGRLLGELVPAPPPQRTAEGGGVLGRLGAGLRDGPGWRAAAYVLLKLPVAVVECYAVACWVTGAINMSYPFWWRLFRNHAPGVRLSPVPVYTTLPVGQFHVAHYAGTFLAFVVGAASLLAAPWVTRAAVGADRWLIRGLLGPGRLAQRVRDLERTRARAVDDSAALLRQVERDLHDGAQVRLAALALNLGLAREKLGADGDDVPQAAAVRELVDAAHRGAKDALAELRDLARGLHPPALDNGLADALATLAAGSAIPVELTGEVPVRPTPAIETIAYFCVAELLANAAKHSYAGRVGIEVAERDGLLVVTVTDDGTGGADPARGSGLAGLAQRVGIVDGRLDIASPPGGPTRVTVELPLRA